MEYYTDSMKTHKINIVLTLLLVQLFLSNCSQTYDPDLKEPDGYGGGYNLTTLGKLVNGPWNLSSSFSGYNYVLYLNDSEIVSRGCQYNKMQRDLVFQLHKNGTLTYWLRLCWCSPKKASSPNGTPMPLLCVFTNNFHTQLLLLGKKGWQPLQFLRYQAGIDNFAFLTHWQA